MATGSYEPGLASIVDRLTASGYADTWKGEPMGVLAIRSGHIHQPEELQIDSIDRFEGFSDPDDQAMVLAVRCVIDECSGTYTVPYGKDMPVLDRELIARIPDSRRR